MKNKIFYIMGVSGTGKSTIGEALSESLGVPFFDGDDFHPKTNIKKMTAGIPLNDEDRKPWLERLAELAELESKKKGAIIACSALKSSYRDILSNDLTKQIHWVFLEGSFDVIMDRLQKRSGHFMPPAMLRSQFDALEIPKNAITVSILGTPEEIVNKVLNIINP